MRRKELEGASAHLRLNAALKGCDRLVRVKIETIELSFSDAIHNASPPRRRVIFCNSLLSASEIY